MASSAGPLTTSAAAAATTATILAFSPSPLFNRVSHVSVLKNNRFGRVKVSCNFTNSDPNLNSNSTSKVPETSVGKVDRRNVLIGIGGLYGAAGGLPAPDPSALGAPIQAPDVNKCGTADVPAGVTPTNCCPPPTEKVIDFKLPSPNSPLRIRPAAHLLSKEYIAKYKKAVQLMVLIRDKRMAMLRFAIALHSLLSLERSLSLVLL